uniref:Uncharacterized protein n=1 Tax=Anguilla anguilla TaxID=7936 RepID=A0A0E9PIA4_ANGAN
MTMSILLFLHTQLFRKSLIEFRVVFMRSHSMLTLGSTAAIFSRVLTVEWSCDFGWSRVSEMEAGGETS